MNQDYVALHSNEMSKTFKKNLCEITKPIIENYGFWTSNILATSSEINDETDYNLYNLQFTLLQNE